MVEELGLPVEEDDEQAPVGDLAILADLGLSAVELAELIDDFDLYPDEILSTVAERLGFGDDFDELAGFSAE